MYQTRWAEKKLIVSANVSALPASNRKRSQTKPGHQPRWNGSAGGGGGADQLCLPIGLNQRRSELSFIVMTEGNFTSWSKLSAEVRFQPPHRDWEIGELSSMMSVFQRNGPGSLRKKFLDQNLTRSKKHLLLKGQRMDLQWQVFSSKCSNKTEVRGPKV